MAVFIVDWLGQGGIFQTSRAWARAAEAAGASASIITRSGGEQFGADPVRPVTQRTSRFAAHVELVRRTAAEIDETRPSTVVIQNYLAPALELPVYRAARRAGSRLVFVVHNHRPHSRLSGLSVGLSRALASADVLVTHSMFVADGLTARDPSLAPRVVDHPVPVGLVDLAGSEITPPAAGSERIALSFGVLKRGYKGIDVVEQLARLAPAAWRFVLAGVGADAGEARSNVERIAGFIPDRELVRHIQQADVCLLPYVAATQSGAVALAQALGRAVLVSAVGGIPEQVTDGVNGRLVPPNAPVQAWAQLLRELGESGEAAAIGARAQADSWGRHERFCHFVAELVL
jgi:glycosyltransferase involved in cell wall biosynthesis